MPFLNEYACRIREPIKGAKTRRSNGARTHNSKKYDVIYQEKDGKWHDQAYRYPKGTWNASEARSHCKSHNGSFEAAKKSKETKMSILDRFKNKGKWSSISVVDEILDQGMIITSDGYDALIDQITEALQNAEPIELTEEPEHVVSMIQSSQTETGKQQYVTVIPISGPLIRKSTWLTSYMGLSSYLGISLALQAALKDPKCIGVLFDVNSPGGQASGLFDLVDFIYKSREIKPIISLSNASAYSAAYAILSAAKETYVVRDGGVGSIGVIMRHFDYSGMLEQDGIKVTSIFAGKRKDDFSPYKPLSKTALKRAQDMVDETYNQFAETVSRNLGISIVKVKATEADIFFGEDAVKQKLAKGVLSYENAVNRAIEQSGDSSRSGSNGGSLEKDATKEQDEDLETTNERKQLQEVEKSIKKESINMNKETIIKLLISDVKYVFTEADQDWLESKSEEDLTKLMTIELQVSREAIRKEIELEIRNESNEVVQVLETQIDALTKETSNLRLAVEVEADARKRAEFGIFVKDNNIPGDPIALVETMLKLSKSDKEAFDMFQKTLQAAGQALSATGLFNEFGAQGEGNVLNNAYLELQEKKVALMKSDPNLTEAVAWRKAINDNKDLYKIYQKEQRQNQK